MKQKGLAPLLIIILIASAVGGYLLYSGKINLNKTQVPSAATTLPSLTTSNETANWKTYASKYITLKYPPFDTPAQKFTTPKSGESTFIVTNKFNFDRNKIPICNTFTYEVKPCLNHGKNHGQEKDIQSITLDVKNAVSFFVVIQNQDGGSDVLHVVQTTEDPFVEIALSIAGMGGEETFQKILSTSKTI